VVVPSDKPDLEKIPDFEAVRTYLRDKEAGGIVLLPLKKWIDKLESWCRAVQDDRTKVDKDWNDEVGKLKEQLEEAQRGADDFDTLFEKLDDYRRGIVDIEEVYDQCGLQVH
jgi:hypothetical protein